MKSPPEIAPAAGRLGVLLVGMGALTGKDLKTGQTLIKTIIAPGLKARLLAVEGWYSTNILGNRDGEVLDDPESFKTKAESKKSVLDYILQPAVYPDLDKDLSRVVRINFPRGANLITHLGREYYD